MNGGGPADVIKWHGILSKEDIAINDQLLIHAGLAEFFRRAHEHNL